MKLHTLLIAAALFNATLAKAYDTDDYGFPTKRTSDSIAYSYVDDFDGFVSPTTQVVDMTSVV